MIKTPRVPGTYKGRLKLRYRRLVRTGAPIRLGTYTYEVSHLFARPRTPESCLPALAEALGVADSTYPLIFIRMLLARGVLAEAPGKAPSHHSKA